MARLYIGRRLLTRVDLVPESGTRHMANPIRREVRTGERKLHARSGKVLRSADTPGEVLPSAASKAERSECLRTQWRVSRGRDAAEHQVTFACAALSLSCR